MLSSWPLTDSVSFSMPLISSLQAWDSLANFQRVRPARRVGMVKSGTITMPISARTQFLRNMATMAMISVMTFERMLVKVLVITCCTPSMSLVIRVMTSPCRLVVKKRWDIFCRWPYIWFRMS